MASINKLSIRGVRAFSPEDEEQVVEFFFPLTIITGANGCGKTTIIESLKFALSGSMPPSGNARSAGQSFVHDPRSIGQTTVKANCKLRFTNKAGASMVVIRSMEVTQKKSTMTFKQLDGVIRTLDAETGERVSLSHKCTELDKQIPSLLGVSKAILDYVLFVHQEDSSWPLQEASVLKKRFDDIFDSTRYSKALDSFRKTKKELASKVKDIKADVAELGSHKHAAKGFRQEKDKQNENLKLLEEELEETSRVEKEADKEFNKYFEIVEQVVELQERMKAKKHEVKNMQSLVAKQRELLEKDLTKECTKEELEERLNGFSQEMKKEKDRQQELLRELRGYEREIDELRQKQMKLNNSKGKVAAEKEAQDKRLQDQQAMLTNMAQTYALDLRQSMTQLTMDDSFVDGGGGETQQTVSQDDVQNFLDDLRKKERELKEKFDNHKANARAEEEEFNTALQDLVGNKNAFENERKKLTTETREIENEYQELTKTFSSKRTKQSQVDEAKDNLKQAEKDLAALTQNDQRDKLAAEIRSFNEKLDNIKDEIESKTSAKKRLKQSASLQAKIDIMNGNIQKDARILHEAIESKKSLLVDYAIDMPDNLPANPTIAGSIPEIADSIDKEYQKAKRKADKANQEWQKAKTTQAHDQATITALKTSLRVLEERRDNLRKRGESVSKAKKVAADMVEAGFEDLKWQAETDNPQLLLDELSRALDDLEDQSPEDVPPDALSKVMKRIRKKGKADGVCPCCRRDFDGNEQKTFTQTLKELGDKENSPFLRGDDDEVKRWRAKKTELEGYRSTLQGKCTSDLNEYRRILTEIADKKGKMDHGEQVMRERERDVDCKKNEETEAKKHADVLRDLHETSKRWFEDAGRINEQSENITDKQESLSADTAGCIGDGTLDEVEERLQVLQEEQASLYEKISKKNKKISTINHDVTQAQQVMNNRAKLLRDKEKKFQEEQKSAERKQVLDKRKTAISKEIGLLGEKIQALQQKIRAKNSEKERQRKHAGDEEAKQSETLNQFTIEMKRLSDLSKLIDDCAKSDDKDSLELIETEVEKVVVKINQKEEAISEVQPKLDSSNKVVDDQEREKKALRDNIELHEAEAELSKVEDEFQGLQNEKVEGGDSAQELMAEAEQRRTDCKSKQYRLAGRRSEMVEQIRSLQRKLQSREYKNIDDRYQEASIRKKTTEMAAADLDKYATALDKALLSFHGLKIKEINKIIKELWLKCYKGNDITNIEIESGSDSKAAKSYNYRVVMSKGQARMDMRGRCSAGQRVLASIVIRLALAETFGVNCGCLVLDEPTVNLDEANRNSLASAMAQIIAARSVQSNFQLVLITHDEEFITLMKDELSTQTGFSMPEKYFKVHREETLPGKYYSKIKSKDWDEIM